MLNDIKRRFDECAANYEALKEHAEKSAVCWRYSVAGELWTYRPMWQGKPRVCMTTEEILKPDEAKFAYGYDVGGNVVCRREYNVRKEYKYPPNATHPSQAKIILHREIRQECFINHNQNRLEVILFLSFYNHAKNIFERDCRSVEHIRTDRNKVVEVESYDGRDGIYGHDLYIWNGNILECIQSMDAKGRLSSEFVVDAEGKMTLFHIRADGSRVPPNRPMPEGVTVKQLVETVRQGLLKGITETVKASKIDAPIYCVVMAYDGEGNDVLGPFLGIGLESERQNWLKTKGSEAKYFIWNPAEFHHYEKEHTQINMNFELADTCEWLNSAWSDSDSKAPAKKLLVEVAAELGKMDWSRIAQITPDFVVYAVDFELADLRKNLKKIISAEKFIALKNAKLL